MMDDLRSSLLDCPNANLLQGHLLNSKYRLMELVGRGGSSLVYRAYYTSNGFRKYVIIKELFPYELAAKNHIARLNNGCLDIDDTSITQFEKYKQIAKTENKTTNELRVSTEIENNNPYFFDQLECFEANNTVYSVLSSESGNTLLTMLYNKENNINLVELNNLADVCQIVLRILEALYPIHSQNKLHLDISPDNIYVSDMAVNGNRIAKIIDFNSLFDLQSAEKRNFSYKEGYSAIELSAISEEVGNNIGFFTDTYSVAAVMFRILKGATVSNFSMHRLASWKIDEKNTYCHNVPNSAIDLCNRILCKGLSLTQHMRYQTIDEMRADINKLYELCIQTPYLIKSNVDFSLLPENIFGRTYEMKRISDNLLSQGKAIISGIGGIGKTTLTLFYAKTHVDEYSIILFVQFDRNTISTICDDNALPIYGISRIDGETDINYFKRKILALRKIVNESTLIIFDGVDNIDNQLTEILTLPCKVIMSGRIDFSIYGVHHIPVNEIEKDEAIDLFLSLSKMSNINNNHVVMLLDAVNYHTFTIELLARQIAFNNLSIEMLIKQLVDGGIISLDKDNVGSAKDRKFTFDTIINHIGNLFSMSFLSDEEREILYRMSIVADIGMYRDAFASFFKYGVDDTVDNLIQKGWLQYSKPKKTLYMHPVASEAVEKIRKDVGFFDDDFVDKCNNWMNQQFLYSPWITSKKLKLQSRLISKYDYKTAEVELKVLATTVALLLKVKQIDNAKLYADKGLKICDKTLNTISDYTCAAFFNNVALLYLEWGNIETAISFFEKANTLFSKLTDEELDLISNNDNIEAIILNLCNIALAQTRLCLYSEAEKNLNVVKKLSESMKDDLKQNKLLACIFDRYGLIAYSNEDYEKAFDLYEKSLKYAGTDILNNAEIYISDLRNMSECLCCINEFDAAVGFAKSAVEVSSELSLVSEQIMSYETLSKVHLKNKNFNDAYNSYVTTQELLNSSSFGSNLFLAKHYNDFALSCWNTGRLEEAIKWICCCLKLMLTEEFENSSEDTRNMLVYDALVSYRSVNAGNIIFNAIMCFYNTGEQEKAKRLYENLVSNQTHLDDNLSKKLSAVQHYFNSPSF